MLEVVTPEKPDVPCKLLEDLNTACERLLRKKEQLRTLVVLFSGHHFPDKGYLLGSSKEYITHDELESKLEKFTAFVEKFVVFLDCCCAKLFKKLDTEKSSLAQLNSCKENENSRISKEHGSIATKFIIQAFTRQARGDRCILESHSNCAIEGKFITAQSLHSYVKNHVTEYYQSLSEGIRFEPVFNVLRANERTSVIAYNYTAEVKLRFTLAHSNMAEHGICFTFLCRHFLWGVHIDLLLSVRLYISPYVRPSFRLSDFLSGL